MITHDEVIRQLDVLGFQKILKDYNQPGFFYMESPVRMFYSTQRISFMKNQQMFWKFSWRENKLYYWCTPYGSFFGQWYETDITDVAQLILLYSGVTNEKD